MRGKHLWIAPCLLVALAALAAIAALGACGTSKAAPLPQPPASAEACADWRWIGISRPGAQCPAPPAGWKRAPLFPELRRPDYAAKAVKNVPGREVIQELERFCVYEIEDPRRGAAASALAAGLERLDRDCAALSIAADPGPAAEAARLRDEIFPAQVGLGVPLKIVNVEGVRLAFLDTHPTGDRAPKTQGDAPLHGFTLTRLATRIVCPEGRCAARITTRLALPIRDFDAGTRGNQIEKDRGGYIGLQGDLAQAIQAEVDAWQRDRSQRHLVLNLSLAWDGRILDGLTEKQIGEMRAGTQAVFRALQYAAGYDALVLAAAGNQKRKPCRNDGPLLPAAWEASGAKTGKPLLYAVGAVASDGERLVNARRGGMPRRAAFGIFPSPDDKGGEPGAILVGSSVSTAVVSSIAAVVWDSFPDLESRQVMSILDGSEKELGYDADFWFGPGAPPRVHGLSLCKALQAACKGRSPCPLASGCPVVAPVEDISRKLLASPGAQGSCRPWVMPQPEDDPCPVCPPRKN